MERAAVFIGVSKSGPLPELPAVAGGLAAMKSWACGQGIDQSAVISDQNGGHVDASEIFKAVSDLVAVPTLRQLIIYFAGHGVNNGYSEYWLLSDAPTNPNAAINLAGSIVLAERSGVPHVVIISDACRTAPDGIQALSVTGSEMFPNKPPAGRGASSVDLFYACLLGDPSYEIRDPKDSARVYESIFTDVLIESLNGEHPQVADTEDVGGTYYQIVRPWPLKRALPDLVTARIRKSGKWLEISQTPDAKIVSDPEVAWISRRPVQPGRRRRSRRTTARQDLSSIAAQSVNRAMGVVAGAAPGGTDLSISADVAGAEALSETVTSLASGFGPRHFETGAGFKVRGARVVDAHSENARAENLDDRLVRVHLKPGDLTANVLLRFDSGTSTLLPVVREFITALTFKDGQLVDVAYEPMDTSGRWDIFVDRAEEVRAARANVAASSRMGVLSLDDDSAHAMAQHMQYLKGVDPSFAVYAAYAYHDLGRRGRIQEMRNFMAQDLGFFFYDVALLAGEFDAADRRGVPSIPVFSRGWALTSAFGVDVPDALRDPQTRELSLWTLFTPDAYAAVRDAMKQGGLS